MRHPFCILAVLLITLAPIQGEESAKQNDKKPVIVTLTDLTVVGDTNTQHPLVCGPNRDFPKGQELLFSHDTTKATTHVVFPRRSDSPQSLVGMFSLRGYYQGIQKWATYTHKVPMKDYRYFVVTSWKQATTNANKPEMATPRKPSD